MTAMLPAQKKWAQKTQNLSGTYVDERKHEKHNDGVGEPATLGDTKEY